MISVDLPEPDTPVTQVKQPERDLGRHVLQVVLGGADDLERLALLRRAALFRQRDLPRAGEILPGEAGGVGHDVVGRALGDDLAAVDAGAGADVDHVVGLHDGVLVVLDDDDGVADVAQVLERAEQALVVALMQPDRRLVEHVEHAGEAGADLRGEADALGFAARQRAGGARQRQIFEADVVEEREPLADLLQDARGDLVLLLGEGLRQLGEPDVRRLDRHVGDFADVLAADLHGQRLRLQAIAAAGFARMRALVALQLLAHPIGIRLAPAPLDVADDAFERLDGLVVARAVEVDERHLLLVGAVEQGELHVLGQLVPRRLHRHLEVLGERLQRLLVVGRGGAGLGPRVDGAFGEGEVGVGHDELGLELQLGAEAVAGRAGAGRRVEREQARLDLVDGEAGDGAGEARREGDALVRLVLRFVGAFGFRCGQRLVGQLGDDDLIVRQPERRLE